MASRHDRIGMAAHGHRQSRTRAGSGGLAPYEISPILEEPEDDEIRGGETSPGRSSRAGGYGEFEPDSPNRRADMEANPTVATAGMLDSMEWENDDEHGAAAPPLPPTALLRVRTVVPDAAAADCPPPATARP